MTSTGRKKKGINYSQEGVDYREFRRGTSGRLGRDMSSGSDSDESDSDSEYSDSETDSSDDNTTFSQGGAVVISAQRPTMDMSQTMKVKSSHQKSGHLPAREVMVDATSSPRYERDPHYERDEQVQVHSKSRRAGAIIQVQQDVDLDEQRLDNLGTSERTVAVVAQRSAGLRTYSEGDVCFCSSNI